MNFIGRCCRINTVTWYNSHTEDPLVLVMSNPLVDPTNSCNTNYFFSRICLAGRMRKKKITRSKDKKTIHNLFALSIIRLGRICYSPLVLCASSDL